MAIRKLIAPVLVLLLSVSLLSCATTQGTSNFGGHRDRPR